MSSRPGAGSMVTTWYPLSSRAAHRACHCALALTLSTRDCPDMYGFFWSPTSKYLGGQRRTCLGMLEDGSWPGCTGARTDAFLTALRHYCRPVSSKFALGLRVLQPERQRDWGNRGTRTEEPMAFQVLMNHSPLMCVIFLELRRRTMLSHCANTR